MKKALIIVVFVMFFLLGLFCPMGSVKAQQDPPRGDCCFHIFSAGSNLGWASSLLNHTSSRTRLEPADETTFSNIIRVGQHIEMAGKTCSAMNPAWTDWKNFQQYLVNQVNAIRQRPDTIIRNQVAGSIRSTYLWGQALRVRIINGRKYEHDTCAEKYFRLGFLLGYAQQTLGIAQEIQRSGRNDWTAAVGDARGHLQASLQVLNEYFNLADCTVIRDLDLQDRITNLINKDFGQLQYMNDAMRAVWESLQQRLTRRCETATGPDPVPPPSGTGLVGVWRATYPQSPTVRFELVNGEYRGFIVELGYLPPSYGWTVGEQIFSFRQEGNSNVFRGQSKEHKRDTTFWWDSGISLGMQGPNEFIMGDDVGNNVTTWRRLFTP